MFQVNCKYVHRLPADEKVQEQKDAAPEQSGVHHVLNQSVASGSASTSRASPSMSFFWPGIFSLYERAAAIVTQ